MTLEARYRFHISVIMSNWMYMYMYGSNDFISNLPCYCSDQLADKTSEESAASNIWRTLLSAHCTAPCYV